MDGIIEVKVNGYAISKDNNCAGTQYENKSTILRITFSDNWIEYGKKITFWNALGENPVDIQLGTNLLEDATKRYNVYLVPIPGAAMTEAGEFEFVIEGFDEETRIVKRTVADKLKVKASPKADKATNHVDPTPDEMQQIRSEIDAVIADIANAKSAANESAYSAGVAEDAKDAAEEAQEAIEGMSVSSETLEVGSNASVIKSISGGVVNLHFGIPGGESGVYMGKEPPTDTGINVWIDTNGEADDVVTHEELEEALANLPSGGDLPNGDEVSY